MPAATLPRLDEHATEVAAAPADVWRGLLEALDATFSGAAATSYARLVGCDPARAGGPRPLATGSAVVGFRVAAAVPARELVLEGRHRFSTYALVFRLHDVGAGRTALSAETRATFPGPAGAVYRQLLLRTGGHVLGVRRLLAAARRRAEQIVTQR